MPPRQLDFCADCQAPIYMENVAGACSCQLGKLKAIQANLRLQGERVRQQIQARVPITAPVPSIAEAVNEVARMRNLPPNRMVQGSGADLGRILMDEARRMTGQVEVSLHTEEPVSPPAVSGENYRRASVQRREYPEDPRQRSMMDNRIALESLWMNSGDMPPDAPLEDLWSAGVEAEMAPGGPLDPDPNEIQFDDGLGIEFENNPDWVGSAPRMRVDRPIPPREPFNARMTPGYADGEVVGNVRERRANLEQVRPGARGLRVVGESIQQIRERSQAQSRDDARQHGLVSTRQASRAEVKRVRPDQGQAAMTVAEEIGRPTVYDRLRKGILDDE